MMTYLKDLSELQAKELPKPASTDTIVNVAGNLMGILLIVAYERTGVVTSKAINLLHRPKAT